MRDTGRVEVVLVRGKSIEDEAGEIGRREYVLVACDERGQCRRQGLGGFWALVCGAGEAGEADRRDRGGDRERHEGADLLGAEIDGL